MENLYDRSLIMLILLPFFILSAARDTLTPTQPLADNETLTSSSGYFVLGFFSPTNSNNRYIGIWYNKIGNQTIVWVANRENPVIKSTGILSISDGGSLTISNNDSSVVWSTKLAGLTNPFAQLLDNGNLVVKPAGDKSNTYAWQSFDYPTDTLIPGMKLRFDRTTGLNYTLTAWKSDNDPSPGEYYVFYGINSDPEVILATESSKVFRSFSASQSNGFLNKTTFGAYYTYLNYYEEETYSYGVTNPSILSRLVVNQSGIIQSWQWESNQWKALWFSPHDQCDHFGICGPYGVCNSNSLPICICLPGFTPKNPTKWSLNDGSDGCIPKMELDCKNNGTDGFLSVSFSLIKFPESSGCTVITNLDPDKCRALCLKNCSCTGYSLTNVSGEESGCMFWVGELLDIRVYTEEYWLRGKDFFYVRVSATETVPASHTSGKNRRFAKAAIITSLFVGIFLLSCVCTFLWKRKKNKQDANKFFKDRSNGRDEENDIDLPSFDFDTILAATESFSYGRKLGEGGFGPVYKGMLEDGQQIAVKRLGKTSQQGGDEFKNEVMLIAKLQHRNLVRLLGYCIHGDERMLIYEYMPNGSLDTFLFGIGEGAQLDWPTRYHIIIGITRGLLYLHHDSRFRVIHRDLKASNILLDKDMNPKISDFGMARIFRGDETNFNTRKVVGTYGYMSPEYALEGTFSLKSDVFSYGVLILEILSGKKNRGVYTFSPHLNLLAHAWSLWNEGKILQLVDESTIHSVPTNDVLKCFKISLLCVQERPEDRPLMSLVLQMFGSEIASLPKPKQPGFVARFSPLVLTSSSSNKCTLNDVTLTGIEGR